MKDRQQCGSVFEDRRCELTAEHFGKHRNTENFDWICWTDAGAERVAKEKAEAAERNRENYTNF
jgi:hypothetical protein